MQYPILVVSKDAEFVGWATQIFRMHGLSARGVSEVTTALELVRTQNIACIVAMDQGEDSIVRSLWRTSSIEALAPMIAVVAQGDVDAAVADAVRDRAMLEKTVDRDQSVASVAVKETKEEAVV